MDVPTVNTELSREIWLAKYRYCQGDVVYDRTPNDTWRRVAKTLASVETEHVTEWEARFYDLLKGFKFLPGGRILAGAGTDRRVTLFNCFVMGLIEDSLDGIFDALKQGALTMQQGGGIGYDFSTIRPYGMTAQSVGGLASGPVSFMRIWDSMCGTVLSTGARRGAMMATLRCDHPDIERFIDAKSDRRELRHFNLSVQITDDFMQAMENDRDWPLVFPTGRIREDSRHPVVYRTWPGFSKPTPCRVLRTLRARKLWDKLMRATYDYAEPGVLFVDRINELNNLCYCETISATNPCGEVPLPPYGACNLGSINLTQFVVKPFTSEAHIDLDKLRTAVPIAARMLDNVIDVSRFPLPPQQRQARGTRRIGLGITGLADALIMLGVRYGDRCSYELAAEIMKTVCHEAYQSSVELACEKGPFPWFDKERYLEGRFVQSLPEALQQAIAKNGIRNSHLTAIAPAGTISLLAGNVSSGLEPIFDLQYTRRVRRMDGTNKTFNVSDYAWRLWKDMLGPGTPPPSFVDARGLSPDVHLDMQAALQPYIDNSISKTINIPEDYDYGAFRSVYEKAYTMRLKGCTTFRPNPVTGSVLHSNGADAVPHCCSTAGG